MKTVNLFTLKIAVCLSPWLAAAPLFAEEGDPPGRVARLSYLNGHVSLQPSGEDQWTDASTNYVVTTGDRVYTDQGSRAELEVGPCHGLRFAAPNSVEFDTPNGSLTVGPGWYRVDSDPNKAPRWLA